MGGEEEEEGDDDGKRQNFAVRRFDTEQEGSNEQSGRALCGAMIYSVHSSVVFNWGTFVAN